MVKRRQPARKATKPRPERTPHVDPVEQWREMTRSYLRQLSAVGDDGLKLRAVVHEACFPTDVAALEFVGRVSSEGFGGEYGKIGEEHRAPMPFGVTFCRVDPVNSDVIEPLVTHLVTVAAEFGGMYAGWECKAQTPA